MALAFDAAANEPAKLASSMAEFNAMVAPYDGENVVRRDYLLTGAQAR